MTAAAFTLVLAIIIGVPYVTKNSATGQLEGKISTGLSLEARADETGEITRIFFPLTGTSEPFTNDIAPDYGGTTGNDFIIRGENIKGINYTAESGRLMCEFESQNRGENGEYIWSSFYDGLDTEEYKARVADIENPTREELLTVAEYVDGTGRLAQLREQMGIGKNDAINYDKIKLSGEVSYKGKSSSAFIFFENTENPPENPLQAQKRFQMFPPGTTSHGCCPQNYPMIYPKRDMKTSIISPTSPTIRIK